jgi:branched-chain amino acid transport system substrate-binding protein
VAAEVVRLAPELVIGHPCAGAALAAAPIYAAASIVFLAPATRHPALTEERSALTVLRVAGRDDRQGWLAGAHLVRLAGGKTVALVSDKTRYGLGLISGAEAALRALGAASPIIAHVASAERDYGELVKRLAESRVAGLVFGGASHEAAILRRQLREAAVSLAFIGGDSLADPAFVEAAGDAAEGTLVMLPPDPYLYPRARDVLPRLDPQGRLPGLEALQSHAAVELWRTVLDEGELDAGQPRGPQIAARIRARPIETVLGTLKFAMNGDAGIVAFALHAWRGRRLIELAR